MDDLTLPLPGLSLRWPGLSAQQITFYKWAAYRVS